MKTLIIYDTAYGNTRKIADNIAVAISGESKAVPVAEARSDDLAGVDLLVVGSPTQGGRPTKPVADFVAAIPAGGLEGVQVAAFDTRIDAAKRGFLLRGLMGVIGYAAPRVAKTLQSKGGAMLAPPEGFFVNDKEGPLAPHESERAAAWASTLALAREARPR